MDDGWIKKPYEWENTDNITKHVNNTSTTKTTNKYDANDVIFVLAGGLSDDGELPIWVKLRLDMAYDIYLTKNRNIICLGGGTYHKPPVLNKYKYTIHESTACAEYMIDLGVSPKHIYKEWGSYDTIANAIFAFSNFIIPFKYINPIIITSQFHMDRTKLIFDWINNVYNHICNPTFISSDNHLSDDLETKRVIGLRSIKENESVDNLKKNIVSKYTTVNSVHEWFYTEHKAYCADSELIRDISSGNFQSSLSNDLKKTY